MSRRVSLPAADDLFRPTVVPDPAPQESGREDPAGVSEPGSDQAAGDKAGSDAGQDDRAAEDGAEQRRQPRRTPSGRVRHDEKMTVYVTADELLDLEHTRLQLRRNHDVAVDRGRLVRTAVAIALADFEANGADSLLVQRLSRP